MKRRVFYSFHYKPDNWRAAEVRNIGAVEGNGPATDNDWETVKRGGEAAIKRWIAKQMDGRTCTVVLVGANTANRKWINYEIVESWKRGMGVVGIRIHGLKDRLRNTDTMGGNPFEHMKVGQEKLSSIVKCYNPAGRNSKEKYGWIERNLKIAVEKAIRIRKANADSRIRG